MYADRAYFARDVIFFPRLPIILCGQRGTGLVLTENSIGSQNAEVTIIREIMVATTMSSFRCLFRSACLQFSDPCRPSGGDSGPSALTGPFTKRTRPLPAPQTLRRTAVDSVVAFLVGLARRPADRSTRHGRPLGPESFSKRNAPSHYRILAKQQSYDRESRGPNAALAPGPGLVRLAVARNFNSPARVPWRPYPWHRSLPATSVTLASAHFARLWQGRDPRNPVARTETNRRYRPAKRCESLG